MSRKTTVWLAVSVGVLLLVLVSTAMYFMDSKALFDNKQRTVNAHGSDGTDKENEEVKVKQGVLDGMTSSEGMPFTYNTLNDKCDEGMIKEVSYQSGLDTQNDKHRNSTSNTNQEVVRIGNQTVRNTNSTGILSNAYNNIRNVVTRAPDILPRTFSGGSMSLILLVVVFFIFFNYGFTQSV